jgi:hypothetical protein
MGQAKLRKANPAADEAHRVAAERRRVENAEMDREAKRAVDALFNPTVPTAFLTSKGLPTDYEGIMRYLRSPRAASLDSQALTSFGQLLFSRHMEHLTEDDLDLLNGMMEADEAKREGGHQFDFEGGTYQLTPKVKDLVKKHGVEGAIREFEREIPLDTPDRQEVVDGVRKVLRHVYPEK